MGSLPTARVRELETLLATIRKAGMGQLNYDMWEQHGAQHAAPEERAAMAADLATALREHTQARSALASLVAATQAEAPAELCAWAEAHERYLAAFLADCAARDDEDSIGADVARREQAEWGEVRRGARLFVDENLFHVTENAERYRQLFGIDPQTLEPTNRVPLSDWSLSFRASQPFTLEACTRALSAIAGPVTADIGELVGNPRDFYSRSVSLAAQSRTRNVAMSISQAMMGDDDPNPINSIGSVTLRDAPGESFATRLATWQALRDALANLGCADITLTGYPAAIVDDAVAAGDAATAARLRADITAALIAEAPAWRHVHLSSTRVDDIERVLAAYIDPLSIRTLILSRCGLRSLPAGCARFANTETLTFVEPDIDGTALRGVSLPRLESLDLSGSGVRQLGRDDLAGFPSLTGLYLQGSQLALLDPDIIKVCPSLRRVIVTNTPLERSENALADLQAQWRVTWE